MARTTRRRLSDLVLEEIRVEMARRRLNQSELAELLSPPEGQPWVSRRLSARTPLTVDDLERIAAAFGIDAADLMVPAQRHREGSDIRRAA